MDGTQKRNWKTWKIGDEVQYKSDNPLDKMETKGSVSIVTENYVIVSTPCGNLWVDDDTCCCFHKVEKTST